MFSAVKADQFYLVEEGSHALQMQKISRVPGAAK
jgi:hypothetical protein